MSTAPKASSRNDPSTDFIHTLATSTFIFGRQLQLHATCRNPHLRFRRQLDAFWQPPSPFSTTVDSYTLWHNLHAPPLSTTGTHFNTNFQLPAPFATTVKHKWATATINFNSVQSLTSATKFAISPHVNPRPQRSGKVLHSRLTLAST